jgi:hypothetical protein
MRRARGENDGFVKRLVFPAVAFTNENAQQDGVGGELHNVFLEGVMRDA